MLASEGFSGSLNIGFMKGCEQIGLADLITHFKEMYPYITLNFQSNNFSALIKSISLYVIIHFQHHFAYKSKIIRQELQDETFIIIKTAKQKL